MVARWLVDGRHVARTFDLKADAAAWEADARRRSQLGAHGAAEPSRDTLRVWLERYWKRDAADWARSTRFYRAHMIDKWIEPLIGGVRLRDLGAARVREWLAQIGAAGCTRGQRNHALRERMRAAMPIPRDALMVSLMAYAGLRPEEVAPLR